MFRSIMVPSTGRHLPRRRCHWPYAIDRRAGARLTLWHGPCKHDRRESFTETKWVWRLTRPGCSRGRVSSHGGRAVYHTIQFNRGLVADLAVARNRRLEQLRVRTGTRLRAQVRPYVVEGRAGPVEVADLFFDGGALLQIPCESFSFVD